MPRIMSQPDEVAELVRLVAGRVQLAGGRLEDVVGLEGAQQLVVARARFVRARKDGVHDTEARLRPRAAGRDAMTGAGAQCACPASR